MSERTFKKNEITEGVIWKQLLIFFFPIMLGTLVQQFLSLIHIFLTFCIGQIFESVLYFLLVLSAIQEVRFRTSSDLSLIHI